MKHFLTTLLLFVLATHCIYGQDQSSTLSIGKIYRTSIDMTVYIDNGDNDYSNDNTRTLKAGLKYRLVGKSDNRNYVKVIEITKDITQTKDNNAFVNVTNYSEKYYVKDEDYIDANKLRTMGLATGSMVLPLKIRPSISVDGTEYTRQLSTDISLGQFIGYRVPLSKFEPRYLTIATTLGTSLINLNSDNTQGKENSQLPLGITWSTGLIIEIKNFQLGLIYGKDWGFGENSKNWIYDGQGWFSFGIGLKFINPD